MKTVDGGVCSPLGFSAGGIWCGIRKKNDKKDLALIVSDRCCTAAGMYTTNIVKAASVLLTQKQLLDASCQAILCNSGNANACTGEEGMNNALRMAALGAESLGIDSSLVAVASTGVIGVPLPIEKIEQGMDKLKSSLRKDKKGHEAALEAIMTTDTKPKDIAVEFVLGGKKVRMGAMAKGAGMIHPNMATMLSFITCDADICPELLETALRAAVQKSFNRVSVDGDTSTNDTVLVLANGKAGNKRIEQVDKDYYVFANALETVCIKLAKDMARDGEGASRLISCTVSGADSEADAEKLAKSVISSSLVKTACFGSDANWGRILCAMGYAGVSFDPASVSVRFASKAGDLLVCQNGASIEFSEEQAKQILQQDEVEIVIQIGSDPSLTSATCWGCDLSYEYVRINGDYRS